MPVHRRVRGGRGAVTAAALMAASALALAGCGGGSGGVPAADARPADATVSATPVIETPEPEPEETTETPTPTPTPTVERLTDQTGATVGTATAAARSAGLDYAVYLQGTGLSLDGGGTRASSWGAGEKVCGQVDDPEDANPAYDVAFTVPRDGRDCAGKALYTPPPAKPAGTGGTTGGSTGGGTGGSTGGGTGGSTGGTTGGGSGTTRNCAITSPAGNCYADGQFCANRHHGMSTYGRGGEYLTCQRDGAGRWRWSDGVPG
ncbi:hypothetical protein [Streptomyces tagetis]|uniref:PASTA domain-containing protein n=1 Tax=Streptomyces tagetis TaxID=2820809 RepID=A0A940XJ09_9ACTN|nr:hypothetical protein [Streptomyces sp. RG38]MBQ0829275.1 hypothetical protein [Streptomyces sp. RG38]